MGAIVWDHEGFVIVAKSMTKMGFLEPVATKTLTALHAVEFSRDFGLHKLF